MATLSLGGAVGFAVAQIAPLGAGTVGASATGTIAALAGWALIKRVDRRPVSPSLA
ncbi:MAG: hypothetical protein H0W92_00765, partial [Sphingomonas sp.]|nr:hypothetical protein [Sphingomonas sp.]